MSKLVQITIRAIGFNLRLRRSLCGKAAPFRWRHFSYNLFSAARRRSLHAAENNNISEISAGKAEPFRKARGEAPKELPLIWTALVYEHRPSKSTAPALIERRHSAREARFSHRLPMGRERSHAAPKGRPNTAQVNGLGHRANFISARKP
jgi:hypothetical protein